MENPFTILWWEKDYKVFDNKGTLVKFLNGYLSGIYESCLASSQMLEDWLGKRNEKTGSWRYPWFPECTGSKSLNVLGGLRMIC